MADTGKLPSRTMRLLLLYFPPPSAARSWSNENGGGRPACRFVDGVLWLAEKNGEWSCGRTAGDRDRDPAFTLGADFGRGSTFPGENIPLREKSKAPCVPRRRARVCVLHAVFPVEVERQERVLPV